MNTRDTFQFNSLCIIQKYKMTDASVQNEDLFQECYEGNKLVQC